MDQVIIVKARAKINLGLTVLGRRPDGFHEIESVMQQVSLSDTILLEPSPLKGWSFFCTDPDLSGNNNLVCRAAEMLERRAGASPAAVRITLFKNIPVEAGLAGGSSDAAAALFGLNRYWQLGLSKTELSELGAKLGSDVPFCLQGGTAMARGRGEILEYLPPIPFFWVVLGLPAGVKISTAAAYSSFDSGLQGEPSLAPLVEAIQLGSRNKIAGWLEGGFSNILETADLPGSDLLVSLKNRLRARGFQPALSGSGPALFMLTEKYSMARSAACAVEEEGGKAYLCWTVAGNEEWSSV